MSFISDLFTNITAFRVTIGDKLLSLASRIGTLSSLTTVAKTNLVDAINEVNSNTPNPYHKWFRVISPGYATTGVLRIDLGTVFTGYLKIHVTGSFTSANSNGYIEISGGLGANTGSLWNNQLRCTTSIGQTRVNFYVDPLIKRDAAGQLYIEIHKKVAANNVFLVEIEAFAVSSFGSSGNTLNPVINAFDSAAAPSALTNEVEIDGDINWSAGGLGLSLQGIRRLVFGSSNVVLAGNTSGLNSIYFRPQGSSVATGQVIIDGNGQINSFIHGNSSQWLQGYNERVSQFNITYATNVYTFSVLLANGVQKQATLQVSSTHFEINPSTGVLQLNAATATKIADAATTTYVDNAISNLKFVSRTYDAADVNNNDRYIGSNIISSHAVEGFDVCVYNPGDNGFISPFAGGSNLHNAFMGVLGIQVGSDIVIKGAVQSPNDLSPFIGNNQVYFCLAYIFTSGGATGVIQFMSMADIYNHKASATASESKDVIIIGEIGAPDILLLNQREV